MSSPQSLQVGVLLTSTVQLLDVSPVDLFGMLTREYLTACKLPAPLIALGISVDIHYIAQGGPHTLQECTANAALRVTASLTDQAVSSGKLDVLMIPGPDPSAITSEESKAFIAEHYDKGKKILSVCTGIFPVASSGILKRKRASGPRAFISSLKASFPDTAWDSTRRFVRDGNIWTSGGITNGQEMVAAYIKEEYPGPLSETVCAMADVGEKDVLYDRGTAMENASWIWRILRAVVAGFIRKVRGNSRNKLDHKNTGCLS